MAVTASQYQMLIIAEVQDPNETLAPQMPTIWRMFADKAVKSLYLQFLYAKREALTLRIGEEAPRYTFGTVRQLFELSDIAKVLVKLLKEAVDEIEREERRMGAAGAYRMGAIAITAPIESPWYAPDANSGRYRGDPNDRYGLGTGKTLDPLL